MTSSQPGRRFDWTNLGVRAASATVLIPAAISGDTVYCGTNDGQLNALDLATGEERAVFRTDGHRANAATYLDAEGRINSAAIYPDRTLDSVIVGLDRQYTLGSVLSSPVGVDGVGYFGSTDGHLYAVR